MLQEDAAEKVFGDEDQPDEVPIEEAKLPDLDGLDDDFDDEDNEIDDDFEPFDGFDDFDNDADDIERHLEESERDSFQSVARNSDSKNSGLAKRKLFFTVLMTVFVVGLVGGGLLYFATCSEVLLLRLSIPSLREISIYSTQERLKWGRSRTNGELLQHVVLLNSSMSKKVTAFDQVRSWCA